jgi:ferredoxin-NADP reductase
LARAAVLGRLTWLAAEVAETVTETRRVRTLVLDVAEWVGHRAGQHVDVRLTAEDGYQAERSYSIASAPGDAPAITVERLDDGEVSPYLVDDVAPGDRFELRGPIGGWFVWDASGPALGVAGGSGAAPLLAMLRHAQDVGRADLLRLTVSARAWADVPYGDELARAGALIAVTREVHGERPAGRLTAAELAPLVTADATCFVCGSTGFAEGASELLMASGVPAERIRVERFGPTG